VSFVQVCDADSIVGVNTSGISSARSYRTRWDGSFEEAFPGTSCQVRSVLSLRDGLANNRHRISS
jgi:hypothetical protein